MKTLRAYYLCGPRMNFWEDIMENRNQQNKNQQNNQQNQNNQNNQQNRNENRK